MIIMNKLKVYIGVPTAESARSAIFYDYLAFLKKPEGTVGASFHSNSGALNRNFIIDDALAGECTHILFIDDDMAFPANALINLLRYDKDAISGLYLNKNHPHPPVIFELESINRHYLQPGESGLIEVGAAGFGFFLVKTKIFASLDRPFVRMGEIQKDKRNEDIDFCNRVRAAGYKVYCDLDTVIGHIGTATFWPNNIDGKWFTGIDTGGAEIFSIAQRTSAKPEIKTPLSYTREDDMYSHMLELLDKK